MPIAQQDRSIDPAFVARVTREVIAQLRGTASKKASGAMSVERDSALESQLQRRGIALPVGTDVLWTEQPAKAVFEHCQSGRRAVMVAAFSDVERFADELRPEVWVLDRKKLNLAAAVNATARIAHLASLGETR